MASLRSSLMLHAAHLTVLELHRVAAELIAQRGNHLRREGFFLARDKTLEQRQRNYRRWHVLINRRLDGPATFTGIFDIAADLLQLGVLGKGQRRQIEQPGT